MDKRGCRLLAALLTALALGVGCTDHASKVRKGMDEERLTVGTVQKEIRLGMSGAEVIEALGSPNVVTTDEKRREVWVYDKFATEVAKSSSGAWFIFGVVSSGAGSRSQRSITIVIKFDEAKEVRDFAYHTSRF